MSKSLFIGGRTRVTHGEGGGSGLADDGMVAGQSSRSVAFALGGVGVNGSVINHDDRSLESEALYSECEEQ